jgi:hypothetical protein
MPETMTVRELRTPQVPVTPPSTLPSTLPPTARPHPGAQGCPPPAREALHEALHCLDTAGRELRRGKVERADEVLALLQAAASHLETAWDVASGREVPFHLRGAE